MSEQPEEIDPAVEQLELSYAARKAAEAAVEGVDLTELEVVSTASQLQGVSTVLRNTGILLEYLSNPDFCKSITKRERDAIDRQVAKIWICVDEVDAAAKELEDDEDEDAPPEE